MARENIKQRLVRLPDMDYDRVVKLSKDCSAQLVTSSGKLLCTGVSASRCDSGKYKVFMRVAFKREGWNVVDGWRFHLYETAPGK